MRHQIIKLGLCGPKFLLLSAGGLREIFLGNAKECARDKLFMGLNKILLRKHIKLEPTVFKFWSYRSATENAFKVPRFSSAAGAFPLDKDAAPEVCCVLRAKVSEIDTAELMKVECCKIQPCVTSLFSRCHLENKSAFLRFQIIKGSFCFTDKRQRRNAGANLSL